MRHFFRRRKVEKRLIFLIATIVFFVVSGFTALWTASLEIPDLEGVSKRKVAQSTKIYDRTGEILLYDLHEDISRTVVSIDEMSRHIKNATVAVEDGEFYEHAGVKPTAILRAAFMNIRTGEFLGGQGGSTITQQVIKKALLVDEKLLSRKIKEWVLAIKLERVLSKEEILELYLNEIPYGGSVYGVEEASQAYFGKRAVDLTLLEAAYLAALPQAPTYYSPYGNHRDALESRKNFVLAEMLKRGFITKEEHDTTRITEVTFKSPRATNIEAPHFVFYVREYLEEKYGENAIEENGFRVITTLDAQLERKAEAILNRHALLNEKNFNAENAGLIALDPRTGEILAMVGSRDYFDEAIDGNFNVTLAKRQPGSAFKPFVYAAAFGKGYTPETVVFDLRTQFSTACPVDDLTSEGDCYSPGNYDNIFRGPVTLRNALAQSINVPSVKVLYLVGLQDALRLAKAMGIGTLGEPDRYGLTLVLGGGEVRLIDMAAAYGTFATGGVYFAPVPVLRIEDAKGRVIESFEPRGSKVLSEEVAMQINDVLSENIARTPAFGETSYLYFPGRDVAAKTGTTNDYRDAWVLGYTPNLVVGAWAGNNDNSPMEKKVAGFIVAPMWNEFMGATLANRPVETFARTEISYDGLKPALRGVWQGGETYVIDTRTGTLATEGTPTEFREERVRQSVHDILHWIDKKNPLGPIPLDPANDPQYRYWEASVGAWAISQGLTPSTSAGAPLLFFSSPTTGARFSPQERVTLSISIPEGIAPLKVDYYVGAISLGSSGQAPFSLSFIPAEVIPGASRAALRAVLLDATGAKREARGEVTIGSLEPL